ncbi:MAG: TorF family putative porin [Steroidobacteraceae bacterium]
MRLKTAPALAVLAALAPALAASAEFSATPTLTSDYDFRGISLSARDPAAQLSLDLATDSGFKASVWGSNTDFGAPGVDTEIDVTLGYGRGDDNLSWDTGIVWYTYPGGHEFNYPEAWLGASKALTEKLSLSGKAWYSWDYANSDDSAYYLESALEVSLPVWDLGLALHAGYSGGDYWDAVNGDGYFDYSIGLTKSVDRFDFALRFIDGSDLPDPGTRVNSTESKVVFSVSTTLPWKD